MSDVKIAVSSNGVATITMSCPEKHNAFDDQMITELTAAFNQVDENPEVKVVVLAAKGKSFSAGGDLAWMKRMADFSHEENLADAQILAHMLKTLNEVRKPTIARVQGAAYGGAVGLVSCCDIAVGSPDATLCLSEVKIGLAPATICPYIVAAIGARASRRYALTAEVIDAATAFEIGLLSTVVAKDQLDHEVNRFCEILLLNGGHAMSVAKKLIADVVGQPLNEDIINRTSEVIAELRGTDEAQKRLADFLNKRGKPKPPANQG